mgnify:CR=1 FL=1
MFNKIAVIGLGNSLRRDDGIGVIILESLLNHYKRADINYLNFGSASFDLIHRLQDYDRALLIDGISAGLAAGQLKIFTPDEVSHAADGGVVSSHELSNRDWRDIIRKYWWSPLLWFRARYKTFKRNRQKII